jgi:hypothetical protein
MNRKQKKIKQRIAREHTKKQAKVDLTPHEKHSTQTWSDTQEWLEREIESQFEPSKNTGKWCLSIVVLCMLTTWLIFKN